MSFAHTLSMSHLSLQDHTLLAQDFEMHDDIFTYGELPDGLR